jgi:5-formyltetrahydrofolate cyclo-ligase
MSAELAEEKRALRRELRARRAALSDEERRAGAAAAVARLLALPELANVAGRTVSGYVAVNGELDPAAALADVWGRGGIVALPRVSAEGPRLRFHAVGAGQALQPGRFGLLEPDTAALEITARELAIVVAPGVAFDAAGRRLGLGGGYYDGVIDDARAGGATVIGFGYDFQVVDRCPAGPGDRTVDVVVTDARVIRVPARQS